MIMKRLLNKLDTFVIKVGDVTINTCDFLGGVTLELLKTPEHVVNNPSVRKTVGSSLIMTSYLTTVNFVSYQYNTNEHQPNGQLKAFHIPAPTTLTEDKVDKPPTESEVIKPNLIVETVQPSTDLKYLLNSDSKMPKPLTEIQLVKLKQLVDYQGQTPFKQAILSMSPYAQHKFFNLIVEYNRITGELVIVKSAYRNKEVQASLKAMYKERAAGSCSSPHAIGAMDIDRTGEISRQVTKMKKLGLLNKFGLWVPPYVGEAWHIEDPEAVYFRFFKKKDPQRKIYSDNVCKGLDGYQHEKWRKDTKLFSVVDTFNRISLMAEQQLAARNITGEKAKLLKEYLLTSVRSESLYGKKMVSPTGALGWWQFTSKTAEQYKLKYPMQLDESMRATIDLVLDNEIELERYGIEPNIGNLYKSHMIGAYGLSLVKKVESGGVLSKQDSEVMLKVIYNQFGEKNQSIVKVNGQFTPKVELRYIAMDYNKYFDEKIKVFQNDNKYLEALSVV